MNFLNPGEKIKKIRKYLKMNQEELQDECISRGLISMIEIGKRALTKDVEIKLVEKFRLKAKELNISLDIDEKYLLRSSSEDAELYCIEKLEKAEKSDDIEDVFEIASKFNLLNVKALFYAKKADFNMSDKDYDTAFINYNEAIIIDQVINHYEKFPYLYWKIGLCKAEESQYSDALSYFNICEHYSIMYKDLELRNKVLYDIALCYEKLDKLELALECLDKYLFLTREEKENNVYYYVNMLKANCYEEMGKYDSAIEIYNCLYKKLAESDSLLGYVYNNLGSIYFDKSDFETSLYYFEKAENIRRVIDKEHLCYTLMEKSKIFIKQHLYGKAIETIKSGLNYANIYKDYDCLLKCYHNLLRIYGSTDNISNLKKTYMSIIEVLKEINNYDELVSAYVKLALIYLNENDIENARYYLTLAQNKGSENHEKET
ncbi:MAG: helix-turn-helix transcriptional regulator [Clostridiales bacterium]|nr:helix-turn-helix transcriptional regulator [Clostridiales bacterium]